MRAKGQDIRPRAKEGKVERLPYEPPRLEVLALRPEEQLPECLDICQSTCPLLAWVQSSVGAGRRSG